MPKRDAIRILENPERSEKDAELQNLQRQMEVCLESRAFKKGLEIALDVISRFQERPTLGYSWALEFSMALGEKEKAVNMLEEAFGRGAWWAPKFLTAGLKELENHPTFPRILEMGRERFEKEALQARTELIVRTPKETSESVTYPLLLVLHGAYSSNADSEPYWLSILEEKRILLASLQSSQPVSGSHYVWDDENEALEDVRNARAVLIERYQVDLSKVILGGVSHGAEIALIALLSSHVPAQGFISVIPSIGAFKKHFIKSNSFPTDSDLRGCIVAGEKDPRYQDTKTAVEFLIQKGVAVQLVSYPELGHTIPLDFDRVLKEAVEFILEE